MPSTSPLARTLVLLAAALVALAGPDSLEAEPTLSCTRLDPDERIRVDGELSEPAWSRAEWTGGFVQSVPTFGAPATQPTEVAFLQDGTALYVAVRCHDDAPEKIRASKLRHRNEPTSDDHVQIIFDTYRDQVRGAVFVVNPLGAKEEGLVNGLYSYTWSWDEVWQAAAAITPAGWHAEIRIPLRLLRYPRGADQQWGVNVKRVVQRLQEDSYLQAPPPPFEISSLNHAALLTGLDLVTRPRNLQAIPYALGGLLRETDPLTRDDHTSSIDEVGLDIKYSLTSDLTLDATYNTDFAQVESDDEQVNLSRYSLFYPEKREFFLENAQLFAFGGGGGGPDHPADIQPFFSRRIGLHSGSTVPIDGGLRLTGKIGRQDVGVLSVATGGVRDLGLDSAWYNVARVRRDLGNRSYIGGIVTDSRRGDFRSTTLGADAMWFITETLSFRGEALSVDEHGDSDRTTSYSAALDLTTDPWGFLFSFGEVDDGFEPDLGFVRRDGYRQRKALLRRSFRPEWRLVRRVSLRTDHAWYDSLRHDRLENRSNRVEVEVEMENGDELSVEASRSFDRLFTPFVLDDALVFAAGSYSYDVAELSYRTDESRRWGLEAGVEAGEFFDGDQRLYEAELWYVLNRHVRIAGSYSSYDISAAHGAVDWSLWAARVEYTVSSNLSLAGFYQHNSSSGADVTNLRLRWILPNDSDLYVVYNDRQERVPGSPELRGRELALKVNYRFLL